MIMMEEEMLHIMGNEEGRFPAEGGYLATNQEFANVHIRVEYKWGVKRHAPRYTPKRDNGVLYGLVGEDKVWPTDVYKRQTMYIDDPYRGIIQEGNWTLPGSYLRAKVDQYQIAKVTNHGRIWRLTYDGMERDKTMPRMNNESAAQLVTHLTHPNGWWRDTAQHLLVLKQDKSVVPALLAMVKTSPNELGRIHALWTLEGLDSLDSTLVRQLMKDADKQVRIQAIRASETIYKAGDKTLLADYRNLTKDPDTDVDIQALLTLNLFKAEGMPDIVKEAEAANKARGEMCIRDRDTGRRGRQGRECQGRRSVFQRRRRLHQVPQY